METQKLKRNIRNVGLAALVGACSAGCYPSSPKVENIYVGEIDGLRYQYQVYDKSSHMSYDVHAFFYDKENNLVYSIVDNDGSGSAVDDDYLDVITLGSTGSEVRIPDKEAFKANDLYIRLSSKIKAEQENQNLKDKSQSKK